MVVRNQDALIVVVLVYVNIALEKLGVLTVVVQNYVNITVLNFSVLLAMVLIFVFIINKDVFAKSVQTLLKLLFEIGYVIQKSLIRNIIDMMQIDS